VSQLAPQSRDYFGLHRTNSSATLRVLPSNLDSCSEYKFLILPKLANESCIDSAKFSHRFMHFNIILVSPHRCAMFVLPDSNCAWLSGHFDAVYMDSLSKSSLM
jgi:hypothetical protein